MTGGWRYETPSKIRGAFERENGADAVRRIMLSLSVSGETARSASRRRGLGHNVCTSLAVIVGLTFESDYLC